MFIVIPVYFIYQQIILRYIHYGHFRSCHTFLDFIFAVYRIALCPVRILTGMCFVGTPPPLNVDFDWATSTHTACHPFQQEQLVLRKSESWFFGTIYNLQGSHDQSCHFKQISSRRALEFLHAIDDEDREVVEQVDVTDKMLAWAAEIATKDLSLPPRKIHELVFEGNQGSVPIFQRCVWPKNHQQSL